MVLVLVLLIVIRKCARLVYTVIRGRALYRFKLRGTSQRKGYRFTCGWSIVAHVYADPLHPGEVKCATQKCCCDSGENELPTKSYYLKPLWMGGWEQPSRLIFGFATTTRASPEKGKSIWLQTCRRSLHLADLILIVRHKKHKSSPEIAQQPPEIQENPDNQDIALYANVKKRSKRKEQVAKVTQSLMQLLPGRAEEIVGENRQTIIGKENECEYAQVTFKPKPANQ
ncbi:hypothetical protein WMY93_026630 [Mugilogobius chulae]|uniref:Uncharacterized protein n=1 Tax=Mugilogobius chulae TaxID=88201 RepID=A0AAW0MZ34_9GOBI